jgi:hypothetical protein
VNRRRLTALLLVLIVAVLGGASIWIAGRGSSHPRPSAGVRIEHTFDSGTFLAVPGELQGLGALKLTMRGASRGAVVESWRFATVEPAVRVRYLLRPFPTPDGDRCPGGHGGFNGDAVAARRSGDLYPCGNFRDAGGARLAPDHEWELVAVFRAPPRGGGTVKFANPEVVIRNRSGERDTVKADYDQTLCVIGGSACARFLERGSFTPVDARRKVRLLCGLPRRPPLFLGPEFRPPLPKGTERGRDDRGRPCTAVS